MTIIVPIVIQSDAINVTTFGAIGNGIVDDTAAIQAAANAAAAAGKQLYFPPGSYNVGASLQMSSNATWIASPGTATLVATAGNPIITAVETQNDTESGLTLVGSTTRATTPQALLIAYKTTGFAMINATVQNTAGIGALFSDVNETTVSGSTFFNVGNNANLALAAQGAAFTNDTAGYGNANIVENSSFTGIGLDAISATGQTGFDAIANTIVDSTINPGWGAQNAAPAGVYGNNDTGLVVADNNIHGVPGNGADIADSSNISVYQNTISGTGSAGIALFSAVNATVSWNTTTNNDTLAHFQSVGGIDIGAQNASNIEIAQNVSGNSGSGTSQPYGIQIQDGQDISNTTLLIAQNNTLTGNSAAAIYDPLGSYSSIPGANMPSMSYAVPINDAPLITGFTAASTTGAGAVKPFAATVIAASNMGVLETVTVAVSGGDTNGRLSGSGILETSTPGTYAIGVAGITPAAATALLQAALFTPTPGATPPGTSISTTLTITDVQTSPTATATVSASAVATLTDAVAAPAGVVVSSTSGLVAYGSAVSGIIVSSGGTEYILAGGTAIATVVGSGGIEIVSSGGLAGNTVVDRGGSEIVSAGGTASASLIKSGGTQLVHSGGVASSTAVNGGGRETVSGGGVTLGSSVNHGGVETVSAGGLESLTVVNSGGIDEVLSGGSATGTLLNSSGAENIAAGGQASGTAVDASAYQFVCGTAISGTVNGFQTVASGGTASGTVIANTGVQKVFSGGVASYTTVSSGGREFISAGAESVSTTVSRGGTEIVYPGGLATATVVASGGLLIDVRAGVASGSILAGGTEVVASGGQANASLVGIGGSQLISRGGVAFATVITGGGSQIVSSGGTASGTVISSGGTQTVDAGGKTSGLTIMAGGTEILLSGASALGPMTFLGSNGTLSIAGTSLLGNVITGFDANGTSGDEIDLTNYSYSSADSVTLGSGNLLAVNLNGISMKMQFDPSQNYAGHYFAVEANSAGQAMIVDPPGQAPAASAGSHAILSATFDNNLLAYLPVIPKMLPII
jgi:autotransporter passenger strand-loop-strand repeat protein